MIDRKADLTMEPSEELNRETLAKMAEVASPMHRRKTGMRRMLTCAALIGAMFILMGAGYKVFPQIAYVPGQGIVSETVENAYILQKAVEAGEHLIDGVSMVPVEEGEHKGKWLVTVVTTESYGESPETISFTAVDGTKTVLENTYTVRGFTRYTGYSTHAAAGNCTVGLAGGNYTVEMMLLSQSPYADTKFPVDQGILAAAYPLSEGSDKLVVAFSLESISEDLMYWVKNSTGIHIHMDYEDFRLIDTAGNTYTMTPVSRSNTVPLQEEAKTRYPNLLYNHETIHTLDRPLEAPAAALQFGTLYVHMGGLQNIEEYTMTIPRKDASGVVPENPILLDTHGMRVQITGMESGVRKHPIQHKNFDSFTLHYDTTFAFAENVIQADPSFQYIPAKDPTGTQIPFVISGREYTFFPLTADSPLQKYRNKFPVTYGDTITIVPTGLDLTIEGNWYIDFTKPQDTGIPHGVIRRGN